jgi:DNA repair exonuclease SbcCD ATPase subunit
VKDQFGVLVQNRNGADTYAGNSGGEKGRADLGINFVISDVVSSRARKSFPQRFFDEPFEGLDEAGVDAVMDLLSDMVAEAGTIFVVTHQQGMQGLFTRNIQMVKEHGSSQLVM